MRRSGIVDHVVHYFEQRSRNTSAVNASIHLAEFLFVLVLRGESPVLDRRVNKPTILGGSIGLGTVLLCASLINLRLIVPQAHRIKHVGTSWLLQ